MERTQLLACAPEGPSISGPKRSPSYVETDEDTNLFYSSTGGEGDHDIHVSTLQSDGTFGPGTVVKSLSTEYDDFMPNVRVLPDGGCEVVFNSNRPTWGTRNLPAYGGQDVYTAVATKESINRGSSPENLGANVNTAGARPQRRCRPMARGCTLVVMAIST